MGVKTSLSILLAAALIFPACLQAQYKSDSNSRKRDDLIDVGNSASINRIEILNNKSDHLKYRGTWVDGQNYSKLFAHKAGVRIVNDWLDTPHKVFRKIYEHARTIDKFVHLGRIYETENRSQVEFDVYIPHPRHIMEAEYNLIEPFRSLQPPFLKTESIEEISIQDQPASIFEFKNNKCALFMKLAKQSVMNISGPCSETEAIVEFANSLSIDRYNKMMNS